MTTNGTKIITWPHTTSQITLCETESRIHHSSTKQILVYTILKLVPHDKTPTKILSSYESKRDFNPQTSVCTAGMWHRKRMHFGIHLRTFQLIKQRQSSFCVLVHHSVLSVLWVCFNKSEGNPQFTSIVWVLMWWLLSKKYCWSRKVLKSVGTWTSSWQLVAWLSTDFSSNDPNPN